MGCFPNAIFIILLFLFLFFLFFATPAGEALIRFMIEFLELLMEFIKVIFEGLTQYGR
jgi:hypothetical protein